MRGYLSLKVTSKAKDDFKIKQRMKEIDKTFQPWRDKIVLDLQIKLAYLFRRGQRAVQRQ
jgi:hypothetical protein